MAGDAGVEARYEYPNIAPVGSIMLFAREVSLAGGALIVASRP
jgi:hypothetical protein